MNAPGQQELWFDDDDDNDDGDGDDDDDDDDDRNESSDDEKGAPFLRLKYKLEKPARPSDLVEPIPTGRHNGRNSRIADIPSK